MPISFCLILGKLFIPNCVNGYINPIQLLNIITYTYLAEFLAEKQNKKRYLIR